MFALRKRRVLMLFLSSDFGCTDSWALDREGIKLLSSQRQFESGKLKHSNSISDALVMF